MASEGFVTISDYRYFPGVKALVASIHRNSHAPIDVGLTSEQIAWLSRHEISCHRPQRSIPVDSDRFFGCYALFDIDAVPFDRIIAVDPDVLVLEDISDLFRRLDDNALLAAPDRTAQLLRNRSFHCPLSRCIPKRSKKKMLKFCSEHPRVLLKTLTGRYPALNSGIVAVRRTLIPDLRSAASKYADFFGDFPLPDQNLLSLCLADLGISAGLLGYEDNAVSLHFADAPDVSETLRRDVRWTDAHIQVEVNSDGVYMRNDQLDGSGHGGSRIRILHYVGTQKPWHGDVSYRSGFLDLWQHYSDLAMRLDRTTTQESPTAGATVI